jgi:hypothetical protein
MPTRMTSPSTPNKPSSSMFKRRCHPSPDQFIIVRTFQAAYRAWPSTAARTAGKVDPASSNDGLSGIAGRDRRVGIHFWIGFRLV